MADNTLALAQGLELFGDHRCEFLFDAEKVMRKSIARLRSEEFGPAGKHQAAALVLLIKARGDLRLAFTKSPSSGKCQKFDREQIQKLRKPKDDDDQAEMLAAKLTALAEEERIVYETLGGTPCEEGSSSNPSDSAAEAGSSGDSKNEPSKSSSDDRQEASSRQSSSKEDAAEQPADRRVVGSERSSSDRSGEKKSGKNGETLDRQQLERRQHEIVLDAYEVKQMLAKLESMTELAQRRMARSTQLAEDVSGALARGDTDNARKAAGEARRLFDELARHTAGLGARDLADKIGAARDQAAELAQRQRALADRFHDDARSGMPSPSTASEIASRKSGADRRSRTQANGKSQQSGKQGKGEGKGQGKGQGKGASGQGGAGRGGTGESGAEGSGDREYGDFAEEAAQLAERGRTLQDVLDALARDTQADGELIAKVAIVREQAGVGGLVLRMQAIQQRLGALQSAGVEADARDVADRLELLAHQLDALHGTVVAPQLNQLIALEKQAAALRERLAKLTSDEQISQWHLDTQALLQKLDETVTDSPAANALRAAMSEAGWGTSRTHWGWEYAAGAVGRDRYFVAPKVYNDKVLLVVEDLQRRARDLLLRDMMAASEESVPPEYENLVERYFEILAHEKREN